MCSDPSIPKTSETHCKTCTVGLYADQPASRNSCKPCSAGFFMPATNKQKLPYFTNCIPCIGSAPGASTCAGCDPGKANVAGDDPLTLTSCVSCVAGTFAGGDALACTDCPPGKYGDFNEDYRCKGCAVGFYSNTLAADNAGMFWKKNKKSN